MAYSELDKNYVRHFVGYGAIWLQAEPRLENAILATQSAADNGGRPDSNTENFIKGLVYGAVAQAGAAPGVTPGPTAQNVTFAMPQTIGLLAIESQLSAMWGFTFAAGKQDEATVDVARGMMILRREGRRLAHSLARMLGMRGVRADVFSSSPVVKDDDPFSYSDMQRWRGGP